MFSRRIPASVYGIVLGAIQQVMDDHEQGRIPDWGYEKAEGEMEVSIVAVSHVPEAHPVFDLMEGLGDERPEGVSGVAEDDEQPEKVA